MANKDAFYFPHDSNAKDDPKCVLLIEELQLEGYGIYWILIETLRDQPQYRYPIKLIPALARRYFTTKEKMMTVINNYELFEIDNEEFFFSNSLRNRMLIYEDKREKAREKAMKRWDKKNTDEMPQQSHGNATALPQQSHGNASKVNESKVNESKVNESKVYYEDKNLNKTFLDFIEMRKKIKEPLTDKAIELAISKLDKLSKEDSVKIEIIEQSIFNNWKGLFGLNQVNKSKEPAHSSQIDENYKDPVFGG